LTRSAGCGLVSINGEVIEAGIELSFGRNAKPSGISFSPIRADFRRLPLGVMG